MELSPGMVGSGIMNIRFFFFQAEDGIRDHCVTGVQTCALPIFFEAIALAAAGRLPTVEEKKATLAVIGTLSDKKAAWVAIAKALTPPEETKTKRSEERGVGKECRSRWSPYH